METKKFRGRVYVRVPAQDVESGDVIMFTTSRGSYCRFVSRVTKANVMVEQPKGMRPRTKRVDRESITECWRRRTKMEVS